MVYLLLFPKEETLATIVAMGDTLVPIHGQAFVPLVGTVGMTFRTELFLLSVVGDAEFFQFFVIYFHSCCFFVHHRVHGVTQSFSFVIQREAKDLEYIHFKLRNVTEILHPFGRLNDNERGL